MLYVYVAIAIHTYVELGSAGDWWLLLLCVPFRSGKNHMLVASVIRVRARANMVN